MYYLTKSGSLRLAAQEAPPLGCALLIAEMFYRFHSFTLECFAFLATWYVFGWALSWVRERSRQLRTGGYRRG